MPDRPVINREECDKQAKLLREKPYVYAKMQQFDAKVARGQSLAILQFQYDYRCNFKCVHCSIKDQQGGQGRRMNLEDVFDLSRQADELGLARFVITGGEPLTFPDFDALVAAIDPTKFYLNVDTNGWFLDANKARHLKEIGVDRVQLSIDSLSSGAHDAFRCAPGSHARAMAAVDFTRSAGLDIFIQTVVTKSRLHSLEFWAFLEHFKRRGVSVFVTFAKPVGAWKGKETDLIDWKDILYMRELEARFPAFTHLTSAYGREGGCISVRGMVSITPFGDVLPCPYHYAPIGNLRDDTLERILEKGMKTPPYDKRIETCWVADAGWKG